MIVNYNDPQFKRGLEVGLSCGIQSWVVESQESDGLAIANTGVLSREIEVVTRKFAIITLEYKN